MTETNDFCLALGEGCCFYSNQLGLVQDGAPKLREWAGKLDYSKSISPPGTALVHSPLAATAIAPLMLKALVHASLVVSLSSYRSSCSPSPTRR